MLLLQYCLVETMGCGDGQYTCSNGECIDEDKKCDGTDDCGNSDDESEGNCPHLLYDGNAISIYRYDLRKNEGLSRFVACWPERDECKSETMCDPWHWNTFRTFYPDAGYNGGWVPTGMQECIGTLFTIETSDNKRGYPLKYGDTVAFKFKGGDTRLSCRENSDTCTTKTCSGWTYWYRGSCAGETWFLHSPNSADGTLIRNEGLVYLKHLHSRNINPGKSRWLSFGGRSKSIGSHWSVQTRTCPGKTSLKSNALDCKYEQLALVKRCGNDYEQFC